MSLFRQCYDWLYTQTQDTVLSVLAAGPIPQHVAFVMDGNRRYARRKHAKVQQGHSDGFLALRRMLEICLKLGVRCVTAYAFSIENFKRSPEEVGALMSLAEEKLQELCQHGGLLQQHGVRLNVLGRKELLPERVQIAARRAEEMTRQNDRAILNLCMPYTSRDEITTAIESTINDALAEDRSPASLSESDIDDHLMTSTPPDVLVRTSGVKRLSDFLLWQCCEDTQIQFTATYWPDFGLLDFIPIILDYQRKVWSRAP
ncbi:Di-trans-poly-cis-decaprenylcistransferase [Neolentinus lepideus HHB14362 ss-1]|uniref:Alkyl transferase n=1 Tax=Neolentinus lepideus HHB14362 ss-1 TaxID=1314782 RepID=A0A165RJZ2_9AGAM|nr:Di-trans-poly-cis-decaprenylcistransferase [Neolentinus lepideus HHB14362 ss-1]